MRRHRGKLILAALVVAVVVLYALGVIPKLPNAQKAIEDIARALGPWTYALVGGLAYLETGAFVGLVAPGESAVIVGGVIAGQGEISLVPLIALVWLCCVLGDTTSFFIGRRLGRGFILRHGGRLKIDEQRLERVESYFERHGGKTILIGRFIGLVRALSPFVAGSSGLPYRRFIPYSVIGCGLWSSLFCVLGYIFYRSFDRVSSIAGRATLAFGITVAVVVGVVVAVRRLRQEDERRRLADWVRRQGERPLLRPAYSVLAPVWRRVVRPLARLVRPELRFLRDRVTPGDLGLELTTSAAVAVVGLFGYFLLAGTVGDDSLSATDRQLLDAGDSLRSGAVTDVVKVVTALGSFAVVSLLVVAVSAVLVLRRETAELAVLVGGAVLVYVAVQLAKSGVDRPRPSAPLQHTRGSSYPSGHAAYSVVWIAAAVALARVVPRLAERVALVGIASAIAVAIGLSRVYLRAHYPSDVVGGWALAAGIFGTCAALALIVAYFSHNGDRAESVRPPPRPANR